ncbi:DNA-directed RNA polymerase subunit delta [Anaerobacillus sp. MEB173]|uniref:DNA-directed RNA polymerase subunit delta n=1 Tax=Anaerobacillus sp. MEB173 TaxID=3383345 RepID=UPI003F909EBD
MSFVDNYSKEEIEEMSMVEVAYELMKENKQPFVYYDLMKKVAEIKGMTEDEVKDRTSFLYTDLNVDGRFLCLGETRWGLRSWYPFEQSEEDITTGKSKKKKASDDDLDDDEFLDDDELFDHEEDDFEDLEDELDDIDGDDDDADDDDFDDTDDEDFDSDFDEDDDVLK